MSETLPLNAKTSPSTISNRGPILLVLQPRLPVSGLVLEIASGTGEHAVHIVSAMPSLKWQPTDPDQEAFASIEAWRDHTGMPNLLLPLQLDASEPDSWPIKSADAIVNINMIHISPWSATMGLMKGASRVLPPGG